MPWALKKVKGGWVVVTQDTGRPHSNHPMTREAAVKQLAVLNVKMRQGKIG